MKSWVESAAVENCHFPIQNLPFGVFSTKALSPRCCTAIGDYVVDLAALEEAGLINAGGDKPVFDQPALNAFMGLGKTAWDGVRAQLTDLLKDGGNPALKGNDALKEAAFIPMDAAAMHLPFTVSEYTDFYAGRQHAFNVGTMFRGPENALPPNWLHIPIGYNGRASTVIVSGTAVRRPMGQLKGPNDTAPRFGPCARLDIELEMGAVVGLPTEMGEPISVQEADDLIFGYVLLNDWSARDIQAWEYQPLGPFQAKAFATSISPWVVSKAALEPFRTSTPEREKELLPYLAEPGPMLYDIELEVSMLPNGGDKATTIARTNYNNMYYSAAQQLAHHASSGCKMNTGDLLGSGTISGPEKTQYGSLLEISWGGKEPLTLDSGETRTFIEDGDTMTLTGWAQGDGYRIGFGECTGSILPALVNKFPRAEK
ncbi:fumarylacetoacetase [Rhodobacteraceae bacterium RKSG542]|uniref:fumarylacetoacetase n=1 Tax=Pseudovibrio flavus TaxID=2529854 RepID=UPI0012BBFAF9|nr:fumarylacetoacetase [Pseudovibrio flavus]MTI16151.1 fumarylacetoacetase [Pseudovibrio flavus]